ncbi:methyl-accepting chemotaxis protein [Paraburkholderia phymatum]|uniref:Methyl-accepting chemotaxis sensory transducer n=1 Tax=Paraburkholderia phymatum (strain DSM 17167 / CIP 108236 / LMG 21445 / STM815) TaxID=391038 RepID=B2JUE4_PARP8|nr:methyl-accepting chemotaxis protein [Paraburkholderia phymatum]ACC74666.1 methyl-accepting chemotaxis sensory transducer [Paraburkholderia phymatum STM815]
MRNVTVRASLLALLVVFASMILLGGVVGIGALKITNGNAQNLRDMARQTILVNDAYKDTARTRSALMRAYTALKERNDTATRDSALQSAQRTLVLSAREMQAFEKAPAFDGIDATLKQQVLESAAQLANALSRACDALRSGDTAAYATLNDTDITLSGQVYSANVEKFQKLANQLSDDSLANGNQRFQWIVGTVMLGIGIAVGLIVLAYLALQRTVTGPLAQAADVLDRIASNDLTVRVPQASKSEIGQLFAAMHRMQSSLTRTVSGVRESCEAINTAAREIAAGNLDLSSRTEEQSASLEETAASMEQLTSTVRQNAENARQANKLATDAADLAQQGGEVVERAVQTMAEISASSSKIADIIGMIDSIAFQTNILALNAAVESARAGEQGRGFAVVAGEVRTLAQRSAGAAREITALIGASIDHVENGNGLVTKAGATMTEIVRSVRNVAGIMGEITTATSEQSDGIEQVGHAVSQMDQVTQQNAALVEQAAAAASALETQAQTMREAVSAFKLTKSF